MLWLLQKGRRSRCPPSHSLVRKSFLQLQCCRVHAAGAHPRRTRPERRRSSSTPSLSSLETEHNTLRLGSFFLRETCPHISALSQLRCPLAAATTKEKGSRRKSHCWAEPSPCLTSSARNGPLHSVSPVSTASTTVISASPSMKRAELFPEGMLEEN